MKILKQQINDALIKVTEKCAVNSACAFLWGEVEMPISLRKKVNIEYEEVGNKQ